MQLTQIQAFFAVVRTGSFSKASEELYITQSSLSHRIHSLEKELAVNLFKRGKGLHQVDLTEEGQQFIGIAEKWIALLDESKSLSTKGLPRFNVSATQTLSNYVMPFVYARFVLRELPVSLSLHTEHYQESYNSLEKRLIDAAFTSRLIPSSRISAIPIISEEMVLLCNAASPYSDGISTVNLPASKGISMIWNHEYAIWNNYWFNQSSFKITADNMKLVEEILSSSDMWAIVPMSAARSAVESGKLKYCAIKNSPPKRPIYLLSIEPQHPYTKYIVEDICSFISAQQEQNKLEVSL